MLSQRKCCESFRENSPTKLNLSLETVSRVPSITVRGWRAVGKPVERSTTHRSRSCPTLLKTNRVASAVFLPVPLTKLISRLLVCSSFVVRGGLTNCVCRCCKVCLFLSGNATVRKIWFFFYEHVMDANLPAGCDRFSQIWWVTSDIWIFSGRFGRMWVT